MFDLACDITVITALKAEMDFLAISDVRAYVE